MFCTADNNGMIYADHDFAKNYFNAVGHNDKFSVKHQLIDEIGKLIISNKKDIVDLLRESGINVSIKDNELKIGQFLSDELSKGNKVITNSVVKLIIDKYNITNNSIKGTSYQKFFKADAKDKLTSNIESGASIANNLAAIFGKIKPNETNKATANETTKLLLERIKLNQMVQKLNDLKKLPTWAKVTISVVGGLIVLGLIILVIKNSSKSKKISSPTSNLVKE